VSKLHITPPLGLQGHRGARGLFPENTLEGFRSVQALGIDAIELDVSMTIDKVVVVSHDLALNPDLTRDAGGAWITAPGPRLRDMTFADVSRFDVGRIRPGSRYAAAFPDQQPTVGSGIPTLAEVLRLLPDMRFTIELKSDPRDPDCSAPPAVLADATLAVIDDAAAGSRVIVESFDWRGPRHVRRVRPDIVLAWLTRPATERDAALWWDGPTPADFGGSVPRAVAAEGGPIWAPEHTGLTPDLVAEAHELGLRVLAWTVNDPAAMRDLLDWGVDGLITDRPDLAPAGAR
jgi:glycerophosphoryl diester phosphodiesterase